MIQEDYMSEAWCQLINRPISSGYVRHLRISHNTPYLPPKILYNLCFFISPGYYSRPKRNWTLIFTYIFCNNSTVSKLQKMYGKIEVF